MYKLTATANTSMKTETVKFIRVSETLKSSTSIGRAGRYIPPDKGPKNPAQVTMKITKLRRAGENAE